MRIVNFSLNRFFEQPSCSAFFVRKKNLLQEREEGQLPDVGPMSIGNVAEKI